MQVTSFPLDGMVLFYDPMTVVIWTTVSGICGSEFYRGHTLWPLFPIDPPPGATQGEIRATLTPKG